MVFLQSLYDVLLISSSLLFLMMVMMMNLVFAGPTGLTLRLIHRDSPESPLYPGNLHQVEKMERAFQQSKDRQQQLIASRMSWVRNSTNSKSLNTVRPPVLFDGDFYMAELGIGTFRNPKPPPAPQLLFRKYYFIVDSGSDLLWLQCAECRKCFLQDAPLFRWRNSSSFHPLPSNIYNPFCKYNYNEGDFCGYNMTYADGSNTLGVLATERLTIGADEGKLEAIDNFVFGCGLEQKTALGGNAPGKNYVVGILGLGGGKPSFLRQLGDRGQMKFEYCLKPWYDASPFGTFLRFGSNTKIRGGGGGVQTARMYFIRTSTIYYVFMYGISVDGKQIVYHGGEFEVKTDGSGGAIFDSGTPLTQLSPQVFEPLKDYLIGYFATFNIHTRDHGEYIAFDLCFERPDGFNRFPTITFHFADADFEIEPRAAFFIEPHLFCLSLPKSKQKYPYSVIFGSIQQVNYRILHDVGKRKISWSKENCVSNP